MINTLMIKYNLGDRYIMNEINGMNKQQLENFIHNIHPVWPLHIRVLVFIEAMLIITDFGLILGGKRALFMLGCAATIIILTFYNYISRANITGMWSSILFWFSFIMFIPTLFQSKLLTYAFPSWIQSFFAGQDKSTGENLDKAITEAYIILLCLLVSRWKGFGSYLSYGCYASYLIVYLFHNGISEYRVNIYHAHRRLYYMNHHLSGNKATREHHRENKLAQM